MTLLKLQPPLQSRIASPWHFIFGLCGFLLSQNLQANELGFPPTKACSFLATIPGMALPTGNTYRSLFDLNDFSCGTRYKDIGTDSPLANNISYYARGTPTKAKRLRILLNINQPSTAKDAKIALSQAAQTLFEAAFAARLDKRISKAILDGQTGKWEYSGYSIELDKEIWRTGKGYEFNFVIRDPAFIRGN